jgi:hypothetical protein
VSESSRRVSRAKSVESVLLRVESLQLYNTEYTVLVQYFLYLRIALSLVRFGDPIEHAIL